MPRSYLIFGDVEGKLDVLRVEWTKCARKGRYYVHKLIARYGRKGNLMKWKEQLNGDCPRRTRSGYTSGATWSVLICRRCYDVPAVHRVLPA